MDNEKITNTTEQQTALPDTPEQTAPGGKPERPNGGKKLIIIIVALILVAAIALGVGVWAIFFRNADSGTLAPDYAPQELEEYAEPMDDGDESKLDQPEGGGAVSLTYSTEVTVTKQDGHATMMFANPQRSNQDMVVQLVIHDRVMAQSGLLQPGNRITRLRLQDGAADQLEAGGYDGKLVVLYYQQDSGEKAVVNTEIPVTVTVK